MKTEPFAPDFLFAMALAKARGKTWEQLSQATKVERTLLEGIPWFYRHEWAKLAGYCETLVARESLAETLAILRLEMPTAETRLKTQLANSVVRAVQAQAALRTPKHKKPRPTPTPTPAPNTNVSPEPAPMPNVNATTSTPTPSMHERL